MHISAPYPFRVSGISADIADPYRHLSDEEYKNTACFDGLRMKSWGFRAVSV
jgi:hypothetical protein